MTKDNQTYMMWQTNEDEKHFDIATEIAWAVEHFKAKYGELVEIRHHKDVTVPAEIKAKHPNVRFSVDDKVYYYGLIFLCGDIKQKEEQYETVE